MTEQASEDSSSTPFWYVLGLMMFLVALVFLAAFFEKTLGLFEFSSEIWNIQKMLFGGIMSSVLNF